MGDTSHKKGFTNLATKQQFPAEFEDFSFIQVHPFAIDMRLKNMSHFTSTNPSQSSLCFYCNARWWRAFILAGKLETETYIYTAVSVHAFLVGAVSYCTQSTFPFTLIMFLSVSTVAFTDCTRRRQQHKSQEKQQ